MCREESPRHGQRWSLARAESTRGSAPKQGVPAGRSVEGLPEGADFRLALLSPAAALPAPSGRLSSAPHSPSPAAAAAAAGILSNRHHPPCKRTGTASAKCHHATASQCHRRQLGGLQPPQRSGPSTQAAAIQPGCRHTVHRPLGCLSHPDHPKIFERKAA